MFHRKRFRLATVTILVLLLTIASASVAAAHSSPLLSDDIRRDPPPIRQATMVEERRPRQVVVEEPRRRQRGGGTTPPSTGGGVSPPATENGLIRPVIYPWPPPNAIVLHAATPIQLSLAGTGLRVYFIARDGTSTIGPFFDEFGILAHQYSGDPVTLYTGTNPGTGKPVTIDYLPADNKLRVSTFYADRPPHDIDKPYVFTVDAIHNIVHEQW